MKYLQAMKDTYNSRPQLLLWQSQQVMVVAMTKEPNDNKGKVVATTTRERTVRVNPTEYIGYLFKIRLILNSSISKSIFPPRPCDSMGDLALDFSLPRPSYQCSAPKINQSCSILVTRDKTRVISQHRNSQFAHLLFCLLNYKDCRYMCRTYQ